MGHSKSNKKQGQIKVLTGAGQLLLFAEQNIFKGPQ